MDGTKAAPDGSIFAGDGLHRPFMLKLTDFALKLALVLPVVSMSSASAQQVTLVQLTPGVSRDWFPIWASDGSGILYSSNRNNMLRANDVWKMNVDGSNQQEIVHVSITTPSDWGDPGLATDKAFVGTKGDLLVLEEQDFHELMRVSLTTTMTRPVARTLWDGNDSYFTDVLFVPGGQSISAFAYSQATGQLAWVAAVGSGQYQLRIAALSGLSGDRSDGAGSLLWIQYGIAIGGMSFSPDGSKLVLSACPDDCSAGGQDLYIVDLATWTYGPPVTVTGIRGVTSRQPQWSPNGDWIAFTSDALGTDTIWLVRPDGTGLRTGINDLSNTSFSAAWSPNGHDLAFTRLTSGRYSVWLARDLIAGFQVTEAVNNGGFETGLIGWAVPGWGTSPPPTISTAGPHSGANSLCLGTAPNSSEPSDYSAVYQWVSIPNVNPTLSFWYMPWTSDSSTAFDGQEVRLYDAQGNYLTTLMQVLEGDAVWKQRTFDLSSYKGQQVALMFDVYQDGAGDPSGMCIDDISLPISIAPPAVLIVPGILGTKLATASEVVWLSNHVINDTQVLGESDFDQLQYTLAGQPVGSLQTTAIASDGKDYGGLFNLFSKTGDSGYALDCDINAVVWSGKQQSCMKEIYVYNNVVTTLSATGYNVGTFAYDWRRDIKDLADDLSTRIRGLAGSQGGKVAIIAHSMGGLVMAEALARHGPALNGIIHSITTLGTPYSGAVATYLYFRGWSSPIEIISPQQMQVLGANWTSVYELLPQQPFVTLKEGPVPLRGTYDGTYSPLLPPLPRAIGSNSALDAAAAVWNDVVGLPQPGGPPFYAIVGTGQPTYSGLIEPKATPGCLVGVIGDGDGTVPLQSATAANWISNVFYVGEVHAGLPSNDQVIAAIQTILQGRSPTNLSSTAIGVSSGSTPCLNQ